MVRPIEYKLLCLGIFVISTFLGFIFYTAILCNYSHIHSETLSYVRGFFRCFKNGPITELEKLSVYGSLVETMVEPRFN